jgi:shikimate kinase
MPLRAGSDRDAARSALPRVSATYARVVRVLVTGMSGAGKSTVVSELRQRGYEAYDADDHGFSEPREDGRWGWRIAMVSDLLRARGDRLIFFAGCSEEQAAVSFDVRVLLSAPKSVLLDRLRMRTTNSYGREARERTQILADLGEVEPLLRQSADLVLSTTVPPTQVADQILAYIAAQSPHPSVT